MRRIQLDIYLYGLNHLGVPPTFGPDDYSAVANGLLFAPLTLMAIVLFGGRRWLTVLVLGCLGGFIAEYLQATLGLARVAELSDALLNAAGAALGAGLGVFVDQRLRRADAPRGDAAA